MQIVSFAPFDAASNSLSFDPLRVCAGNVNTLHDRLADLYLISEAHINSTSFQFPFDQTTHLFNLRSSCVPSRSPHHVSPHTPPLALLHPSFSSSFTDDFNPFSSGLVCPKRFPHMFYPSTEFVPSRPFLGAHSCSPSAHVRLLSPLLRCRLPLVCASDSRLPSSLDKHSQTKCFATSGNSFRVHFSCFYHFRHFFCHLATIAIVQSNRSKPIPGRVACCHRRCLFRTCFRHVRLDLLLALLRLSEKTRNYLWPL